MTPEVLATWTYVCHECNIRVQLTDDWHDGLAKPYNLDKASDKAEKLGWERHFLCQVVDAEVSSWSTSWLCGECVDEMREAGLLE